MKRYLTITGLDSTVGFINEEKGNGDYDSNHAIYMSKQNNKVAGRGRQDDS